MASGDNPIQTRWGQMSRGKCCCCLALVATLGCNVESNFSELGTELFAPGVAYIEAPGDKILDGEYRRFSVRSPDLATPHVVALNTDGEMEIAEFVADAKPCKIEAVRRFGYTQKRSPEGDAENALLPYHTDIDGSYGLLHFTDFKCNERSLTVPNTRLPNVVLERNGDPAFLLLTGDNELVLADPWNDTLTKIGGTVRHFVVSGSLLWTRESGSVVVRDADLEEKARHEGSATELVVSPYTRAGYFVADGDLYRVDEKALTDAELISEDACGIAPNGDRRSPTIQFLSPCQDRRLVLYSETDAATFSYGSDVIAISKAIREGDGYFVNYWTSNDAGAEYGDFWLVQPGQEPEPVADDVFINTRVLYTETVSTIVDFDGEKGRYIRWEDGEEKEIATDVAERNSLGILANFDGDVGDLLRIKADLTTEELGSGVPRRATEGRAFVANYDGSTGDLLVLDDINAGPRQIATGVVRRAYLFSAIVEDLLLFLSDYDLDSKTGTLGARLLNTGDQFEVSRGVSEILEVGLPRPGVLYSRRGDDRAGLWFATAR